MAKKKIQFKTLNNLDKKEKEKQLDEIMERAPADRNNVKNKKPRKDQSRATFYLDTEFVELWREYKIQQLKTGQKVNFQKTAETVLKNYIKSQIK